MRGTVARRLRNEVYGEMAHKGEEIEAQAAMHQSRGGKVKTKDGKVKRDKLGRTLYQAIKHRILLPLKGRASVEAGKLRKAYKAAKVLHKRAGQPVCRLPKPSRKKKLVVL